MLGMEMNCECVCAWGRRGEHVFDVNHARSERADALHDAAHAQSVAKSHGGKQQHKVLQNGTAGSSSTRRGKTTRVRLQAHAPAAVKPPLPLHVPRMRGACVRGKNVRGSGFSFAGAKLPPNNVRPIKFLRASGISAPGTLLSQPPRVMMASAR